MLHVYASGPQIIFPVMYHILTNIMTCLQAYLGVQVASLFDWMMEEPFIVHMKVYRESREALLTQRGILKTMKSIEQNTPKSLLPLKVSQIAN